MMKSYKTLLFIALVVALLGTLCAYFPKGGIAVGTLQLHFPTLTKILNPQKQLDIEAFLARQDSLDAVLQTQTDSLTSYRNRLDSSDIRFWFPNNNDTFFDALFADLEQTQRTGRTIRIVHYGDSQIEMDRMTNRLRVYMHMHPLHALQLIGARDLAVHDAVTVVDARVSFKRRFNRVQDMVQASVADGMYRDLHTAFVCLRDEAEQCFT